MNTIWTKTFSELTTAESLEIHGLGEAPLSVGQLSGLFSVVSYRFDNLLPTTTYTDMGPFSLAKAICDNPEWSGIANAIVARLWEMGVQRQNGKEATA